MTVQELYARIDGDYDEAVRRLRMEKLISRFIVRFLDDSTCSTLISAWENQDEKGAFEAAHAAKGVCANLSLPLLSDTASTITEALRPGNEALREKTDIPGLMQVFKEKYESTVQEIRAFAAEQE